MQTIITAELAEHIARDIRNYAAHLYQSGDFSRFARGQAQGQMTIVGVYMSFPKWIRQGIENELDFFCERAIEQGQ